jgi:hypothetical protein
METVQVSLSKDVFVKLQEIAEPLIDDINSVIERLINNHLESLSLSSKIRIESSSSNNSEFWRSNRGEQFKVGTKLSANYKGKSYNATIQIDGINFEGNLYDSPSAAGVAVKKSAGITGSALSTDGWSFWNMLEPDSNQWVSINTVRYEKKC